MLSRIVGSSKARSVVALPPSSFNRQTKPGLVSASALIDSRLLRKSAMRGSSIGASSRPTLIWAMCIASSIPAPERAAAFSLLELQDHGTDRQNVALPRNDPGDRGIMVGAQHIRHLHRLDDRQRLTRPDFLAGADMDRGEEARH